MIVLRSGSATDVGMVRSNNQDSLLVADPLFAVADGMGGAAAGEVASMSALEALAEHFPPEEGELSVEMLADAALAANRAVWAKAEAHPEMRGMGTTLVALALVGADRIGIVNIGDSRLYRLSGGELEQVTTDHNLVAEMLAEGRITKADAEFHPWRNMMTRAVGVEPDVEVDRFVETARHGDRYLLCSDGLPRELNDDLIASMLRRFRDAGEAARELVAEAKRRGGNDNITVVVVDIVDTDLDDPTAVVPLTAPADDAGEAEGAAMVPAAAGAAGADGAKKKPRTKRMKVPTTSPLTVRVVGFILLLLVVIGAGLGGLLWYGRSGYFVTTKGSEIVVYQGRPGGVLWIKPTLAKVTSHTTDQVLPSDLQSLHSGQQESSLGASVAYVDRLYAQYQQAQLAAGPTTTVPTSTTTSSTATTRPASATTRVSTATTRASTVTSRAVPTTARP